MALHIARYCDKCQKAHIHLQADIGGSTQIEPCDEMSFDYRLTQTIVDQMQRHGLNQTTLAMKLQGCGPGRKYRANYLSQLFSGKVPWPSPDHSDLYRRFSTVLGLVQDELESMARAAVAERRKKEASV